MAAVRTSGDYANGSMRKWTGALDSSTNVPSGFYTAVPHLPVSLRLE